MTEVKKWECEICNKPCATGSNKCLICRIGNDEKRNTEFLGSFSRNNGFIEMYGLKMKDNQGHHTFANGSVRDSQDNKVRLGLIWYPFIEMLGVWCTMGAVKYAPDNWKKGQPLHQYRDSILRHIYAGLEGRTDETHLIAAAWNIMAYIYTEQACLSGDLPEYYLTCGANKRFTEEDYLKWEKSNKEVLDNK